MKRRNTKFEKQPTSRHTKGCSVTYRIITAPWWAIPGTCVHKLKTKKNATRRKNMLGYRKYATTSPWWPLFKSQYDNVYVPEDTITTHQSWSTRIYFQDIYYKLIPPPHNVQLIMLVLRILSLREKKTRTINSATKTRNERFQVCFCNTSCNILAPHAGLEGGNCLPRTVKSK